MFQDRPSPATADPFPPSIGATLALVLVLPALLIGSMFAAVATMCSGERRPLRVRAKYELMTFLGNANAASYDGFESGHPWGQQPLAPVHLRLPDGTVAFLPDLTKEQAARIIPDSPLIRPLPDYWGSLDHGCHYREGKLINICLKAPAELSPNRDGPFIKLPARVKDVERVMGKPLEVDQSMYH